MKNECRKLNEAKSLRLLMINNETNSIVQGSGRDIELYSLGCFHNFEGCFQRWPFLNKSIKNDLY